MSPCFRRWGEIVREREELPGLADAVMVMSMRGFTHLEDARPVVEAGMLTYVDRHLADSYRSDLAIPEFADRNTTPVLSASALWYAAEIQDRLARREQTGAVIGALACSGPGCIRATEGLYGYAIHAVETLDAPIGPGDGAVSFIRAKRADMATGLREDGRLGAIRGIRRGESLCRRILRMTRQSPNPTSSPASPSSDSNLATLPSFIPR